MRQWPEGVGRLILDQIDSTNAEATRQARVGIEGPIWILAHRQTQARGRQGRVWAMPEGNFAASLLMSFAGAPGEAATRFAQAASLATAETCDALAPGAAVEIKWPNDVLVNRKKVAGILIENLGPGADGRLRVVTGIGINLYQAPPVAETHWPATSLVAEGADPRDPPNPEEALSTLAACLDRWLATPAPQLLRAWVGRLYGLGTAIEARLPAETLAGIFDGVDETGALVLKTNNGVRHIPAADVFFPEA